MRSRKYISKAVQAVLFLVMVGCLEPIGVATEDASGQVIITGQVSTIEHRTEVNVAQTAGADRKAEPLSGCAVRIVDDLGNFWDCNERAEGLYKPLGLIGLPGRTYHVEVRIPGGEQYRSEPEKMSAVIGTDELVYDFSDEAYIDADGTPSTALFINFRSRVNLQQPEAPYYLKWTVNEVFLLVPTDFPDPFGVVPPSCYVTRTTDPQRVVIFDGSRKESLDREFLIATRLADRKSFHSKYSAYIYRSSVTPAAYEYWRKVGVLVSSVGSIFDTPPAEIDGNIFKPSDLSETVYGFFQASNETYRRITLQPGDMPYTAIEYCEYNNAKFLNEYPGECLNCLNFANSSFFEPELFRGSK